MCGIFALLTTKSIESLEINYIAHADKLKHRGPDASSYNWVAENVFFAFHRLCVVGDAHGTKCGMQPFVCNNITTIANCEIYNFSTLISKYKLEKIISSNCDAEIIAAMYSKVSIGEISIKEMYDAFDGVFAFVIYDASKNQIIIGRDLIGVRSLYIGIRNNDNNKHVIIASEMKAIPSNKNYTIFAFEPGTINILSQLYCGNWQLSNTYVFKNKYENILSLKKSNIILAIKSKLENAVEKRIMCNNIDEIGCLLSGGLDSSIITSILVKKLKVNGKRLKTFSIGMQNSTDLKYARIVADYFDTDHHEVIVTPDYLFSLVDKCIYHIESYDITTIRASIPMMALSLYIANTNIKIIFSGEGADEASGSYLYFHNAPSLISFRKETIKLLNELHYFDVLRCDKSTAAAGLEVRVPFLDKDFLKFYMAINTKYKIPMFENNKKKKGEKKEKKKKKKIEKYLLRKAFENELPSEITWRIKEALSDGISSMEKPWFEILQDKIILSDSFHNKIKKRKIRYEKEYYKKIFNKYYINHENIIPHYWMPKWSGNVTDPSARILTFNEIKKE
jgi:asparagine synthase (glutamine-hydrolysing)